MAIGDSKKINMEDSSSSGESDEDENVFMGDSEVTTKGIKKRKLSRADYTTMKRELKRRGKVGSKGYKRRVEKLAAAQDEIKSRFQSNMEF